MRVRAARVAKFLATGLALVAGTGCAGAFRAAARPYLVAPGGLELPEQQLRDALAARRWDDALARSVEQGRGAPGDALLRELYYATGAYYAGRWRESAAAMDRAATMADDRFTKRVSRGALALVTNDRALPYVPGQNERLFVHYYALLAYLQAQDVEGAAVEARRLGALLQRYDDGRDRLDVPARAVLRYLTGVAFEAAGEREDAAVAYRNARALAASLGAGGGAVAGGPGGDVRVPPALAAGRAFDDGDPWLGGLIPATGRWDALQGALADTARARLDGAGRRPTPPARPVASRDATAVASAAMGEVVVVVERGFVAHRVSERLTVETRPDAPARWGITSAGASNDAALDGLAGRIARLLDGDAALWADALPATLTLEAAGDSDAVRGGASGAAGAEGGADSLGRATPDRVPPGRRPFPGWRDTLVAAPRPVPVTPSPDDPPLLGRPGDATAGPDGRVPRDRDGVRLPTRTGGRGGVGTGGRTGVDPIDVVLGGRRGAQNRRGGAEAVRATAVGRMLTIAWPAYRRPVRATPARGVVARAALDAATIRWASGAVPAVGVVSGLLLPLAPASPVAGDGPPLGAGVGLRGDVSLAVAGDFKRDRTRLLTRLVARAALRQTLAAQAGRKHRELGDLVSALGSAVEHADTRSWHLLPGSVEIVRLRLPAGRRALVVDLGGREVPVGAVEVPAGGVGVATVRLWDDGRLPLVARPAVGTLGGI